MDADLPFSGDFPAPAYCLRILDAQAPFGIWMCDTEGVVRILNPAFLEVAGMRLDPCRTPGWTAPLEEEELRAAEAEWRRCLVAGERWDHEFRVRTADGRSRHVLSRGIPSRDTQGRIRAWVGLNLDITDVREGDPEVRRCRERVLLALSAGGDFLYEVDLATGARRWFGPVEDLLGGGAESRPASEASWTRLVHPEDRAAFAEARLRQAAGLGPFRAEYRLLLADGNTLHLLDRGRLVAGSDGSPRFLVGIVTDLTASRLAGDEARRGEERRRAGQRLEVIGRLAGGIAHDFNNLLTAINGFSDLLAGTLEDGSQKAYAQEIRRAGERAAQITRQLLAFSRRQICAPRVLDLNRVAADMARAMPGILGDRVRVEVRPDPLGALVKADPSQVEQVFLYLAANARDAMPRGGTLTIGLGRAVVGPGSRGGPAGAPFPADPEGLDAGEAEAPGPYVVLTVQDDGEGLDEEEQSHLFEPFFPSHGKPHGLGLSAVYGIVKQNGGHIMACSRKGEGTIFRILWPRHEGTAEAAAPAAGHPLVLVAEDDAPTRDFVRDILERGGFRVLTAASGQEALDALREAGPPPDLLLADVVMPGMGGLELAGRAGPFLPAMKILFMSGYGDHHLVRQGVLAAGKAFIRKPFAAGDLLAKIQEILAVRQAA